MFVFGELLKGFRVRAGLTQFELANELGVDRNSVGNWERSEFIPSRDKVLALEDVLSLSSEEIDQLLEAANYLLKYQPQKSISPQLTTTVHHFMTLERYLTQPGYHFPKLDDFNKGLVYISENHINKIEKNLKETGQSLLVGRSASGKTALALAFAKRLQEAESYEVFYKDAILTQQGDGRAWYIDMSMNDHKKLLYIIDNCHLAPEEVNQFCFQWEVSSLKYAQVLLISRLRSGDSEQTEDYFDVWNDVTVEIQPEEIYYGILEKYAATYRQQDPNRYETLENDSIPALENLHSHNLVSSKSRLEAWHKLGGRLSDVTTEAVYEVLAKKYLSRARESLLKLCALWQFEIPIHNIFVENELPTHEVLHLAKEKLLTGSIVPSSGMLYELTFHPQEAQEIFKAGIYRKQGSIEDSYVVSEITSSLRTYLKSKPINYITIYTQLASQKQKKILHFLLLEEDLQNYAASQFKIERVYDAIEYIFRVSTVDILRSKELLHSLVKLLGSKEIAYKILLNFPYPMRPFGKSFQLPIQRIHQVDIGVAKEIIAEIDMKQLSKQIESMSLNVIFGLVRSLRSVSPDQAKMLLESIPIEVLATKASTRTASFLTAMLRHLQNKGYPSKQLKALVEAIDMKQVAQRDVNLQALCWLALTLRDISIDQLQTLVEAIDMKQVAQRAKRESPQSFFRLLRTIKTVSPSLVDILLKEITPEGLVSSYKSKETTISDFTEISRITNTEFRQEVYESFLIQDIIDMLGRSKLGPIGNFFLYHQYPFTETTYAIFQGQLLEKKLMTEPLDQIGTFLHRLRLVPEIGPHLAFQALELLVTIDLSERIACTDLEHFGYLLFQADSVDKSLALQLLASLKQKEYLHKAIKKSSIHGIQSFIYNASCINRQYGKNIQDCLQSIDLALKLAKAEVADIAYFLWNTFTYIDENLAQTYCEVVDLQQRSSRLRNASMEDLCLFLWNLVQIGELSKFETLNDPVIMERLTTAWKSKTGLGVQLFGIISLVQSPFTQSIIALPIKTETQKDHLESWLKRCIVSRNSSALALTLQGLRTYNEELAKEIARKYLLSTNALQILEEAPVMTTWCLLLLQEVGEWLINILKN